MFSEYQNKYKNHRCFIIGSGRSLIEENLELLKNEKIFILNRAYKALDIGLPHYNFYVNVDQRVYEENAREIQEVIKFPRFYSPSFLNSNTYWDGPREKFIPVFKHSTQDDPKCMGLINGVMPLNYELGWGKTASVVIDAILIAFFMGFSKMYLLGIDLNVSDNLSTHFYGNEKRLKSHIKFTKKNDFISTNLYKIIKNIIIFSNNFNFEVINLSRGYVRKDLFKTDTLKNMFN